MLMQDLAVKAGSLIDYLAAEGRVFYASDADQNDLVTGQTTFAATTPTFMVNNPTTSGVILVPLLASLTQTGGVAGGAVDVIMTIDNAARYSSGGTAETVLPNRTGSTGDASPFTNACTMYSGATASAGYGVRLMGLTVGQDISPAEGAINEIIWTPPAGLDYLVPGSSWMIYTYATTTGPTWFWTMKWAEIPVGWIR